MIHRFDVMLLICSLNPKMLLCLYRGQDFAKYLGVYLVGLLNIYSS